MTKISKKAKRRFTFLTICLFGVIVYLIISTTSYWTKIYENKKAVKDLEKEYQELLDTEASLKSEVTKLQDGEYVARYASEKYLYSKDGMTIIRIVD